MLTKKQSDLLRFIHERLKETGVPPSFDEMKDGSYCFWFGMLIKK